LVIRDHNLYGVCDTAYEAWKCCEIICNGLSCINMGKSLIIYQQIDYSMELLLKVFILLDDYTDAQNFRYLKHIEDRNWNLQFRLPYPSDFFRIIDKTHGFTPGEL